MDNIAAKALALVNGVKIERGRNSYSHYTRLNRALDDGHEALCRAIEQHEAFRQEVSDVVEQALSFGDVESLRRKGVLSRFIITKPKPDPLEEVLYGVWFSDPKEDAKALRAALEARGLEIREKK